MASKTNGSVQSALNNLNEKVDIIYKHQSLLSEYSSTPGDYGTGYLMTEVEAHTIGFIDDQCGITATELAEQTHRTKGAISQLIAKLEAKGLVRREAEETNKRTYRIYLTDEGKRACEIHRAYDRTQMLVMINDILQKCTLEEIDSFFKVLNRRNEIIEHQLREKKGR